MSDAPALHLPCRAERRISAGHLRTSSAYLTSRRVLLATNQAPCCNRPGRIGIAQDTRVLGCCMVLLAERKLLLTLLTLLWCRA